MCRYILVIILNLVFLRITAQQDQSQNRKGEGKSHAPAIGHIYAKIVDDRTGQPVPYAPVAIYKKDSLISGQLTKDNGEFSFEKLPFGSFALKISFIGFKDFNQAIRVVPGNEEQDLGNIKLIVDQTQLEAAEIVEEKNMVEIGIDRRIFNVDKNIVSRGGTATDVMKNIPSVTMDEDGNAQLRQHAATIYVDGRPTTLSLDMIPADEIDKVEIISNPSAKFEASSTGGIINIVTKSNVKPGYNGVATGGIGTNNRYNGSIALNIRQKSIGIALSYNYNTFRNPIHAYNYRTNLSSGFITGHYNSENNKIFKNTFSRGSGKVDYYMNNRNTLSFTGGYTHGYFNTTENQLFTSLNGLGTMVNYGTRTTNSVTNFYNYSGKASYRKIFPKKDKELTSDITVNTRNSSSPSNFTTFNYDTDGSLLAFNPVKQSNMGNNLNSSVTLQVDFVNPLSDSSKIEMGWRSNYTPSLQKMDISNYNYTSNDYETDQYLTNHYRVNDLVNAAYFNYSNRFRKINYMAGVRFEASYYEGILINKNDSAFKYVYPSTINNIFNALFPAIFLNKRISEKSEIQLNISRKIQRPRFHQISPFVFSSDRRNFTVGNPGLTPEFITMAELNLKHDLPKGSAFVSLFYRNSQNPLTNFNYASPVDSSIVINTTINGKQENTLGMDYIIKYSFFKKLETTLSMNLFYSLINATFNNTDISNQGFYYTSKLNTILRLPKNFGVQLSGTYESPEVLPQGRQKEMYFADCGVSKEILKFITFTLSVSDIFNTKGKGNILSTPDYIQEYWSRRETRYVKLTALVKFGKADATFFKRKQTGRGDDSEGSDF